MAAASGPLPQAPARAANDNTICTLGPLPVIKMAPGAVLPCPAPNQDGGSVWHFGILPALKMAPPSPLPSPTESRRAPPLCTAPHPPTANRLREGRQGANPRRRAIPAPAIKMTSPIANGALARVRRAGRCRHFVSL